MKKFKSLLICGSLLLSLQNRANAETLEELWKTYDDYVESSDDAFTIKRYELAKRIALVEKTEESERSLIDLYAELSPSERTEIADSHFKYALEIQKKYPNSTYVQTALCWSALLQNKMLLGGNACQRAYELDFMYAPSIANMAHIHYSKGDIHKAEALLSQTLIANEQGDDWIGMIKKDFRVLPNIYLAEEQEKMISFIDSELKSTWYVAYKKLEDSQDDVEAKEADYNEEVPVFQKKKQPIVSERFGDDSLINGYHFVKIGEAEIYYANKKDEEARPHYKKAVEIYKQHNITKDNSKLAKEAFEFLEK